MNMKLLFSLVLLFIGVFGSAQISIETKVDEILMKSGIFEARKMVFVDFMLSTLQKNGDSSRVKSIRARLTDEKILESMRKPYLEMFSEKEIDELHRFYTSKTVQKLLSNYELLEQKTNENLIGYMMKFRQLFDREQKGMLLKNRCSLINRMVFMR